MEEHEELADDLESEADDLERQGDEVSGRLEQTKQEWERKQQDSAVPGAEPPHEEDHEGYRGHSEAETEAPGGDAAGASGDATGGEDPVGAEQTEPDSS